LKCYLYVVKVFKKLLELERPLLSNYMSNKNMRNVSLRIYIIHSKYSHFSKEYGIT